jgi:hypothetical protein
MSLEITTNETDLTVTIEGTLILKDELLYHVFKNIGSAEKKTEHFIAALKLGVHGLQIDEVQSFISRAEKEVDVNLSILKAIRRTSEVREQTTLKGEILERELDQVLNEFIEMNNWADSITLTGSIAGALKGRKVGDLTIDVDNFRSRLVIEAKLDENVSLGDLKSKSKKDVEKTAHAQLFLAMINREAELSLIVFDSENCHSDIGKLPQDITFVPTIPGIIVKIKKRTGDYAALLLAYSVARELSLVGTGVLSSARLNMALERSCRDLDQIKKLETYLKSIEKGAGEVNKGVKDIRDLIVQTMESFNRTSQLLNNSINGEVISDEEWLAFFVEK